MTLKKLGFLTLLLVAGCGGGNQSQVDIGSGRDDHKASPCACVQMPLDRDVPEGYREHLQRELLS